MDSSSTLFEISWEVCNKVGGIYTVLTSKAPYVNDYFKNYFLVGPYFESSKKDFTETKVPKAFEPCMGELEGMGIKVHFGTTDIKGKKKVILVEHLGFGSHMNGIKKYLWDEYQIDSLNTAWYDYDEAILWSWVCGIVIDKLSSKIKNSDKILVHSHEWMSGGAIFYLNSLQNDRFRTIFTTHATMLGRALSGHGENLYSILDSINPHDYAYSIGVHTKHQTEKTLARISDCFTTVSDITNDEAKTFYAKEADVLLYNGFDNSGIESIGDLNHSYLKSRVKTNKFVSGFFHDFYDVDMDKTKIIYTSGRNEFRNKGYDVYIRSLAKLNERLKQEESEVSFVNLFLVILSSDLRPKIDIVDSMNNMISGERLGNSEYAPICTHEIGGHEILDLLNEVGLNNHIDDKVKNIFIPVYLDGTDELISREYYELVKGLDLGVFPSFYEPWGYTPLECVSFGVSTITSSLAGFGRSILENYGDSCPGVDVLYRTGEREDDDRNVVELSEMLHKCLRRPKKAEVLQREIAKMVSMKYDWSTFIENYMKAYRHALKNLD